MKLPSPVVVATAKVSAFQDFHPLLSGVVLVIGAALLVAQRDKR
jgi:hypothetical protein